MGESGCPVAIFALAEFAVCPYCVCIAVCRFAHDPVGQFVNGSVPACRLKEQFVWAVGGEGGLVGGQSGGFAVIMNLGCPHAQRPSEVDGKTLAFLRPTIKRTSPCFAVSGLGGDANFARDVKGNGGRFGNGGGVLGGFGEGLASGEGGDNHAGKKEGVFFHHGFLGVVGVKMGLKMRLWVWKNLVPVVGLELCFVFLNLDKF